jgi:hypothetical protein
MNKDETGAVSTANALKMAIGAMETSKEAWHQIGIYDAMYDGLVKAINACKEALEQSAQEPVAWVEISEHEFLKIANKSLPKQVEEVNGDHIYNFWKNIEKRLKELNNG